MKVANKQQEYDIISERLIFEGKFNDVVNSRMSLLQELEHTYYLRQEWFLLTGFFCDKIFVKITLGIQIV